MSKSISNFFTEVLGANLTSTRWSWGAYNPQTNQLFLRVWNDDIEHHDLGERISILRTDRKNDSLGYPERIRHVELLRKGCRGYGVICTAKDTLAEGRNIASFNQDELLQFGTLIDDGHVVYANIEKRVSVARLESSKKTDISSIVPDIKSIVTNRRCDATEREALANARVGQGVFRAQVLRLWNSCCCVTGSAVEAAIRASHIKPWRVSSHEERLDPYNGLPLIATLDALFDAGLITFEDDGALIVSHCLEYEERVCLGLNYTGLNQKPNEVLAKYLAYHREHVFVQHGR